MGPQPIKATPEKVAAIAERVEKVARKLRKIERLLARAKDNDPQVLSMVVGSATNSIDYLTEWVNARGRRLIALRKQARKARESGRWKKK